MEWLGVFGAVLALQVIMLMIGQLVERRLSPAVPNPAPSLRQNLAYLIPIELIQTALAPVAALATMSIAASLGAGYVSLPASGAGFFIGFVAYLLAMDAAEFAFHWAQHRSSFLWSMHSLHHSDASMNVSTTWRHFWGDGLLKSMTVYPLVAVLFKTNGAVLMLYTFLSLYNYLPHANVRLGFGRWSCLLNSPQFHRLHHSSRPEDFNINYAALFPVFDLICGTYRRPEKDEYPTTGLMDEPDNHSVWRRLVWPLRGCDRTWATPPGSRKIA